MANSGWVRVQAPAGCFVQVGVNSGNDVGTPVPLGSGGGNLFSAWVKSTPAAIDTIVYVVNHTGAAVVVATKWNASDGSSLAETHANVPAFGMIEIPASANVPA